MCTAGDRRSRIMIFWFTILGLMVCMIHGDTQEGPKSGLHLARRGRGRALWAQRRVQAVCSASMRGRRPSSCPRARWMTISRPLQTSRLRKSDGADLRIPRTMVPIKNGGTGRRKENLLSTLARWMSARPSAWTGPTAGALATAILRGIVSTFTIVATSQLEGITKRGALLATGAIRATSQRDTTCTFEARHDEPQEREEQERQGRRDRDTDAMGCGEGPVSSQPVLAGRDGWACLKA